jgi:hypothetical protein
MPVCPGFKGDYNEFSKALKKYQEEWKEIQKEIKNRLGFVPFDRCYTHDYLRTQLKRRRVIRKRINGQYWYSTEIINREEEAK